MLFLNRKNYLCGEPIKVKEWKCNLLDTWTLLFQQELI